MQGDFIVKYFLYKFNSKKPRGDVKKIDQEYPAMGGLYSYVRVTMNEGGEVISVCPSSQQGATRSMLK